MTLHRTNFARTIFLSFILAPGCSLPLAGAPCPCISSMTCCESTMTCMEDMVACPRSTADGSVAPQVSGACLVVSQVGVLPLASEPDIGRDYARQFIPGVNDLAGLGTACTRPIYQRLLDEYCTKMRYPAETKIITYNPDGSYGPFNGPTSTGGFAYCGVPL